MICGKRDNYNDETAEIGIFTLLKLYMYLRYELDTVGTEEPYFYGACKILWKIGKELHM